MVRSNKEEYVYNYHFWEKSADEVQKPSTYEEPRSNTAQTPSTPSAQEGATLPDPHAEDKHKLDLEAQEQALQHKQELHEQRMRHTEELHSVKVQSSGTPSDSTPASGSQQQADLPMDPQQAQAASQSNLLANYVQAKMGKMAAKDRIQGGKAEGMSASEFPADQLRRGTEVEKEHTPDPAVAREIAKDHLEEFDNYYTELDKMEKGLKAQKEKRAEWHELKAQIREHLQKMGAAGSAAGTSAVMPVGKKMPRIF